MSTISAEDLAVLSPEEREAWEVCQKAQYGAAHGFTTEAVEKALANTARNLLPPLLLKVARITRELADHRHHVGEFLSEMYATMIDPLAEGKKKVADTCRELLQAAREQRQSSYDLREALSAAESRVSDLTKEKDSALQERDRLRDEVQNVVLTNKEMLRMKQAAESERDRYKQERDAAMKSSDENHAKFVAADQACESAEQELSLLRSRKDYHGEYVEAVERVVMLEEALREVGKKARIASITVAGAPAHCCDRKFAEIEVCAEAALKGGE